DHVRPGCHRGHGARGVRSGGGAAMSRDVREPAGQHTGDHAADKVEILPVTGLPEFRPGDDLTGAIAQAAPWLRSGDVVVVTSKVLSKVEGMIHRVDGDADEREVVRRRRVTADARRGVATVR